MQNLLSESEHRRGLRGDEFVLSSNRSNLETVRNLSSHRDDAAGQHHNSMSQKQLSLRIVKPSELTEADLVDSPTISPMRARLNGSLKQK